MVNCRAKVPHHLSSRDSSLVLLAVYHKLVEYYSYTAVVTRWKYLGSTLQGPGVAKGMIDPIMVSVREMAYRSDEDPDGKGRMSVSVRKHQGSEMVSESKRLLQVVSCVDLEWRCSALFFREPWSTDWMAWVRASKSKGGDGSEGDITAPAHHSLMARIDGCAVMSTPYP